MSSPQQSFSPESCGKRIVSPDGILNRVPNYKMDVARLLSTAKYMYQDQAKRDINGVINCYRGLKPVIEKCHLPTGTKRDLVVLKGTIPVSYRNATYNIPVSLWILHNHPESAPICWVNPTKDMTIKVSQHVNDAGRIFLPYLADWTSGSSDLLGVIQVMIIVFGETPPLYSKPKPQDQTTTSAFPNASNMPKPNTYQPSYPYANVYPAVAPVTSTSYSGSADPNASIMYPHSSYMQTYTPPTTSAVNTDTIPREHIRISLVSAAEDKLKARSKELIAQYSAEIGVLKKTCDDLNNGKQKLDNIVKTIENNLVQLSECKEKLKSKDAKVDDCLAKADSTKETLNIDEYFGPVQPLYKQLFNAFAEENAIVDTTYNLNEALQKGVIDLDVFIKHVRELSRRQFMLRALVKVCREKAGLPT